MPIATVSHPTNTSIARKLFGRLHEDMAIPELFPSQYARESLANRLRRQSPNHAQVSHRDLKSFPIIQRDEENIALSHVLSQLGFSDLVEVYDAEDFGQLRSIHADAERALHKLCEEAMSATK